MHFFSIDQKILHFFVKISQYFKDHLRGEAACFRLKVRGERLKARGLRLRSKLFICCRPMAGSCVYIIEKD